jgi:hypothetical protein
LADALAMRPRYQTKRLRAAAVTRANPKIEHAVVMEGPLLRASSATR